MNNNNELVVRKSHSLNNPDTGILEILYISKNNGKEVELPSDIEFPTKGIFFSRGYEKLDKQIEDDEVFYLTAWDKCNNNELENSENRHHHWAKGSSFRNIEPSVFIPIYKGALPDISIGCVDINNLPVNKPFFINQDNVIYGPFVLNARLSDGGTKVSPYSQQILSLLQHKILKIKSNVLNDNGVITPVKNDNDPRYIVSLRALANLQKEDKEEVDFISDEQLVSYFAKAKIGKKTILSKKEAEKLKRGVVEAQKKREIKNDNRILRLKEILDKYLELDSNDDLINDYLNSEKGKVFLSAYVESKPDLLTKATKGMEEIIQKQEERLESLQNDIQNQIRVQRDRVIKEKDKATADVVRVKEEAEQEIEIIRKTSQEDKQRESEEASAELCTEIIELEKKRDEIKNNVDGFLLEEDEINNLKDVRKKTNYLDEHSKVLEKAVETQKSLLSSPELGGKITEVKTVIDMLQGRSLDQRNESYIFNMPEITDIIPDHADQYIQTLVEFFENDNHSISFEELTNLLVNIQQSFLTILSGLPGSGKTSSVTRLSIAQGLCLSEESNSDCFLNVPVARGWVSSRDFVGFNNSLKGVYQPAKTGVYQFLRQGEQENSSSVLRMILLDEANLSPMEHYWSDFLAMCDKEGRKRPLDTGIEGDKRLLVVADNVRFIATINNDNTTEPLSPRLCDRVPVISMDAPIIESAEHVASLSLNGAVPYDLLNNWFGENAESDYELPPLIVEFCEKMNVKNKEYGTEIHISQRKRNAMTSYCEVASRYIDLFMAIDFALSQHALPLINGHGKEFRKRLENLEEIARDNKLERTSALLGNILNSGQTYIDSYSYF